MIIILPNRINQPALPITIFYLKLHIAGIERN